jgi:hypothetical protein
MAMTEIGCQVRQMRLNVSIGSIPPKQRLDGKVMPQVMYAGAASVAALAQASLASDRSEPFGHRGIRQSRPSSRNKKAGA